MTQKLHFTRQQRLLKPEEFRIVRLKADKKYIDRGITVFVKNNNLAYSRLGLTIAKKEIPTAVQRNRCKRVIRETFRLNQYNISKKDILFLVSRKTQSYSKLEFRQIIEKACLYFATR